MSVMLLRVEDATQITKGASWELETDLQKLISKSIRQLVANEATLRWLKTRTSSNRPGGHRCRYRLLELESAKLSDSSKNWCRMSAMLWN